MKNHNGNHRENFAQRIFWQKEIILLFLLLTGFVGCSSNTSINVTENDLNVLNRVYSSGELSFKKSRVEIKVYEKNSIVLRTIGDISRRPSGSGSLMIPVTLSPDLPEYYSLTGDNKYGANLQAYQGKDGLWCIVAVIEDIPSNLLNESVTQTDSIRDVQFDILLISSKFQDSLPLFIPSGWNSNQLDGIITLNDPSRYFSTSFVTSSESDTQLPLTQLPPSINDGEVKAAVKLVTNASSVWNFSGVTFDENLSSSMRRNPILFILGFLYLVTTLIFFWVFYLPRRRFKLKENRILGLKDEREYEIGELRELLEQNLSNVEKKIRTRGLVDSIGLLAGMVASWSNGEHEIFYEFRAKSFINDDERKEIMKFRNVTREFFTWSKIEKKHVELEPPKRSKQTYWTGEAAFLSDIKQHLVRIKRINKELIEINHSRKRVGFSLLNSFVIFVLTVGFMNAQIQLQQNQNGTIEVNALGELTCKIIPDESENNKLNILLSFIPLAKTLGQNQKGEVGMGLGESNGEISNFKYEPDKLIEPISVSSKAVRVRAPITQSSSSVLGLLAGDESIQINSIDVRGQYASSVNNGNLVKFDYLLDGTFNYDYHTENDWIHWFPFDTKTVEIPFRFAQPALLKEIEMVKPKDFYGDIVVSGFEASFWDKGKILQLQSKEATLRSTIQSNQDVKFVGSFRRSWFQRLFLTLGQLIFAMIAGLILGIVASKPSRIGYTGIVEGVGFFGIAFVIRSTVFSSYPGMPNLLAGQTPITILDLCYVLSLILLLLTSIFVCFRRLENRLDSRNSY